MLSFFHARQVPGRVVFSQDALGEIEIKKNYTGLKGRLVSPFENVQSGFSAVLKANAVYEVFVDQRLKFKKRSDAFGYLDFTLTLPAGYAVEVEIKQA